MPAALQLRLSGGSGNSDPNASLGGAISSTAITSGVANNLFDDVTEADVTGAADLNYRCIYVINTGDESARTPMAWVSAESANAESAVDIGLGTSAVNATEQTVADEDTAPAGVTFSHPTSKGTGLAILDIPAGEHKAIWLRRTVGQDAARFDADSVTVRVEENPA